MPSEWVKCTTLDGKTTYVNMAIAISITAKRSTRISFQGENDPHIDVTESVEEILKRLDDVKRSQRG